MSSPPSDTPVAALRARARAVAHLAHVPYSRTPVGAALLLSDGAWVAGVRLESVSFPLTIPALQGAWVTAFGAGRFDIVAAALSRPFLPGEAAWLSAALEREPEAMGTDALLFSRDLPPLGGRLEILWDAPPPSTPSEGVAAARVIAGRAHAPFSRFHVGCLLEAEGAGGETLWVPGVNVEHPDWTRGLCAERSALAGALALGARAVRRAFLSCPQDPAGTPCGGCRQLLAERLPDGALVMDRGPATLPEETTARALLPNNFRGEHLRR